VLARLLLVYSTRRSGTITTTIDGITYRLDLTEMIDSNLNLLGAHEPRTMETVRRLVMPGATAIDVGANAGYYSLVLARLVGPAGRVIAFEPTEWAFQKLVTNVGLNAFENIRLERVALADVSDQREISSSELAFKASWPLSGVQAERPKEVVEFLTLDDYVERRELDAVDFIKVDVDGYEFRVIQGARKTLARFRPSLLIEIGKGTQAELGDDPLELVRVLNELGYTFYNDERTREFASPEELIDSISWDHPAMILCLPS
jgi:FkbM family methyltransferase